MLKPTPEVNQSDSHQHVREETLRTLFDREESNLLRYAFSLTGRRAVAEEIVQDVFLKLNARWDEVKNPRAWLFRSVRNRAFNHLRKSKREILQSDEDVDNPNSQTDSHNQTPDADFARMEAAAALRKLLGELGETDRELVKLKYFEDLKYREISERTGLTISNVGYRLHHILRQLASSLQPLGIDNEQ